MANGKFSNPRSHREEDRQIEETFRQLTGQQPVKKAPPQEFTVPGEEAFLSNNSPYQPVEEAFPKPFEEDFDLGLDTPRQAAPISYSQQPQMPRQFQDTGAYTPPLQSQATATYVPQTPRQPQAANSYPQSPQRPVHNVSFEEPIFDDPAPEEDMDFLDRALAFVSENKKLMLAFACAAALLMLVVSVSIFFKGSADPYDGKILDNIYIADIHVGGLTQKDAVSLVKQATSQTYPMQDMIVDLDGRQLALSPKDTGAKLDVQKAVDAAYAYGRTGTEEEREQAQMNLRLQSHVIALLPYLNLDQDYILETLRTYAEDAGSTLTQTSYGLEGVQPELAVDKFNKNAPTQTLVITMGTPGIGFDYQDVYNQVMDAYSLHRFLVTVENVEATKDPDPIDLEVIYEEFYIAPVDSKIDLRTYETIPGSYGYEFNLEEAQIFLNHAEYGQEIRIPMMYIEPEILDADMLFRDVLGEVTLSHASSKNRNENLLLACEAINGTIVNPGEQFSFNTVVGNRTSANGYKSALEIIQEIADETDEEILGGGISQVASALYQAALLSDLQIDYRVSQDFIPAYAETGLDVLVAWRTPDLQFSNSTIYPIRIDASASNGKVTIQIVGTDERDYYIKLESSVTATQEPGTQYKKFEFDNKEGWKDGDVIREGVAGVTVKVYKCKYDKSSGQLLSRDFEATSQYKMVDTIVARVEPEPTEPPTEAPTVPPTEPPTQPTVPPTTPPTVPSTVPPTEAPTQPEPSPTEAEASVEEAQESRRPSWFPSMQKGRA